uniref:Ld-bro-i n=1 Tax=Lymantria dispar multicapsid nuclear polyhedrosis virus TaxID=10449 RepID=A0A513WWF6_NPVLD|nr:Ld-bro-i [Lymantria dispar multiple nucleopolyhedrovirus]
MAKERMKFVYETILPTIRKTGKFEMSKTSDVINYDARMKDMQLAMQRLSEAANMTMTQFAVNALLAKDNIFALQTPPARSLRARFSSRPVVCRVCTT